MSLPATEAFTGTGALSGSWTQQYNTIVRSSDQGTGSAAFDENYAYWSADSFGNDQYSKCVVKNVVNSNAYVSPSVRASGSGASSNFYDAFTDGVSGTGHTGISKVVNFVETELQAIATTFAANDEIKVSVTGTTIQAFKNGVQIGSNQSDSTFSTGAAGVTCYNTQAKFDDWEGGNVGGGGSTFPPVPSPLINPSLISLIAQ